MRFFEDVIVGEIVEIGRHTFSAEEIKSFAARFDPQPFHLDEAAAARTHFGRLCASGWHTASMWMRFEALSRLRETEAMRARGEPVAQGGPSPGFRELKWSRPVYVGDTITFSREIVGKRLSSSRPHWGLLSARNLGVNQHGLEVLSFLGSVFVQRRSTEPR